MKGALKNQMQHKRSRRQQSLRRTGQAFRLSPATLAIAFVHGRWFCASTIVGATSLSQLEENIDSSEVSLTDEVLAEIDAIHVLYPNSAIYGPVDR